MKTRKTIPTLLFAVLLSVTMLGCDSGGSTGSGASGAVSQPTTVTASNPPSSGNNNAAKPTSPSAGNSGDVKLTLVKSVPVQVNNPAASYTDYIGIVRNDSSFIVTGIQMQLVDASGAVSSDVTNESALVQIYGLQPGQSAGFNMMSMGTLNKNPQFKLSGQPAGDATRFIAKITIVSQQASTSPSGQRTIDGTVRNDGVQPCHAWGINYIAYDASGNVVDTGVGGATESDAKFDAQDTQPFRVTLSALAAKATRFDLFASGIDDK